MEPGSIRGVFWLSVVTVSSRLGATPFSACRLCSAQHPQLDVSVAYCTLQGAEPVHDPDFNTTVQWDIPLVDGYSWQEIPNHGSGADSFWELRNSRLWKLIHQGHFDAVVCYLSYLSASFWVSYFACRFSNTAFLFGTDASSILPRSGTRWKAHFKTVLWLRLHSLSDQVFVPSAPAAT
jgi:hypothetical protein